MDFFVLAHRFLHVQPARDCREYVFTLLFEPRDIGCENLQSPRINLHIDFLSHFYRFAIHVEDSRFFPFDFQAGAEQGDHLAVLVDILGEQLESGLWDFIWIERFQYRNVHFPIFHVGIGGDVGLVAIL